VSLLDPATWLLLVAFLAPMGELRNYFGEMFSATKVVMVAAVACSLAYKVVHREVFHRSALDVPILLFMASFVFSFAVAEDMEGTAFVWATIAGYLVLNVVICNSVESSAKIYRIVIALVVGVSVASMLGVMQAVTGRTYLGAILGKERLYQTGRSIVLLGTAKNPNAFGVHFAVAIPLVLALLLTVRKKLVRLLLCGLIVLFVVNLLWTLARGAMLGTLAGTGVMVAWLARRNRRLAAIPIVVGVCLAVFLSIWWKYYPAYGPEALFQSRSTYAIRDKVSSVKNRGALFMANIGLFLDHPIIGVGYGMSKSRVCEYGAAQPNVPHNNFLGIACELGIVGLVPFVAIIVITVRGALRAIRRARDPATRNMLLGLLGAFTAQHVIGLTHANYVSVSLWLTTGLLIASDKIIERPKDQLDATCNYP
jgi:O-antigen ligase